MTAFGHTAALVTHSRRSIWRPRVSEPRLPPSRVLKWELQRAQRPVHGLRSVRLCVPPVVRLRAGSSVLVSFSGSLPRFGIRTTARWARLRSASCLRGDEPALRSAERQAYRLGRARECKGAALFGLAACVVLFMLLSGFAAEHLGSLLWTIVGFGAAVLSCLVTVVLVLRGLHPGPDVVVDSAGIEIFQVVRRVRIRWDDVRMVGDPMSLAPGTPFEALVVPLIVSGRTHPRYCGVPEGHEGRAFAAELERLRRASSAGGPHVHGDT